jgi:hypothetical protein
MAAIISSLSAAAGPRCREQLGWFLIQLAEFPGVALSPQPPPIVPTSPLQLEVGPQNQGGSMMPRVFKMQHRRPDPPLKAGELDFDVPLLPTS